MIQIGVKYGLILTICSFLLTGAHFISMKLFHVSWEGTPFYQLLAWLYKPVSALYHGVPDLMNIPTWRNTETASELRVMAIVGALAQTI